MTSASHRTEACFTQPDCGIDERITPPSKVLEQQCLTCPTGQIQRPDDYASLKSGGNLYTYKHTSQKCMYDMDADLDSAMQTLEDAQVAANDAGCVAAPIDSRYEKKLSEKVQAVLSETPQSSLYRICPTCPNDTECTYDTYGVTSFTTARCCAPTDDACRYIDEERGSGSGTGTGGTLTTNCGTLLATVAVRLREADMASDAAARRDDLNYLIYTASGIGGVVLIKFYLDSNSRTDDSDHRSNMLLNFELYFMITAGGLLDAATDVIYVLSERFASDELRFAAISVLALPIVIVFLSFWAVVARSYAKKKWRVIFVLFEGVYSMLTVLVFLSIHWSGWVLAWTGSSIEATHKSVAGWADTLCCETTKQQVNKRSSDGSKIQVTKEVRFWNRGCGNVILACIVFPSGALLVEICLFIALLLSGTVVLAFSIVAATATAIVIPLLYAVMALLRIFVIFPTLWELLADWTVLVASKVLVQEAISETESSDDDQEHEARIKRRLFGIYGDNTMEDVKDSAIKYMLLEFLLESVPQICIQTYNNVTEKRWTNIGSLSMAASIFNVVSTMYKYGYLELCAPTVAGGSR